MSNLFNNGIESIVSFLADFLFFSNIFIAHLDPLYWALFFWVICKFKASFLNPLFKLLVENLLTRLMRFYWKKPSFAVSALASNTSFHSTQCNGIIPLSKCVLRTYSLSSTTLEMPGPDPGIQNKRN